MELKNRLKELRRDKRLSAGDLAALTGKAESTVRTWESGKSFPDTETLLKLAEHYRVSVDWLLGRVTYESQEQAAVYEEKFLHSAHKRHIEELKKQILHISESRKSDTGKSLLFLGWYVDTLKECTELFDRFLNEIDAAPGTGSQNSYLEIIGAVNKLWADIAFNYSDERNSLKATIGEV